MESLLAGGVLKTRGRGRGAGEPEGRSQVRLNINPNPNPKTAFFKKRDLDPGPGSDPRFTDTHSQVRSVTFRSDLEVYYWVVRKGQTQDELRL